MRILRNILFAGLFTAAALVLQQQPMQASEYACPQLYNQCDIFPNHYLWDVGQQGPWCDHEVHHKRVQCADGSGQEVMFEHTCEVWTQSGTPESCNTGCYGEWCHA